MEHLTTFCKGACLGYGLVGSLTIWPMTPTAGQFFFGFAAALALFDYLKRLTGNEQ
tara:strand:- start:326 stop:493 length:168 start_codon:yes stop_codon:yes gene_type:complete